MARKKPPYQPGPARAKGDLTMARKKPPYQTGQVRRPASSRPKQRPPPTIGNVQNTARKLKQIYSDEEIKDLIKYLQTGLGHKET